MWGRLNRMLGNRLSCRVTSSWSSGWAPGGRRWLGQRGAESVEAGGDLGGPAPGGVDAQPGVAAAAGEAGSDVQDAVAERRYLAARQRRGVGEADELGPADQVGRGQERFEPAGVYGEPAARQVRLADRRRKRLLNRNLTHPADSWNAAHLRPCQRVDAHQHGGRHHTYGHGCHNRLSVANAGLTTPSSGGFLTVEANGWQRP